MEPNVNNPAIKEVAAKTKENQLTNVINLINATIDEAVKNEKDVRIYSQGKDYSCVIYDPKRLEIGGELKPYSDEAWLYIEYLNPGVGTDQRRGEVFRNQGETKPQFTGYLQEYERIWDKESRKPDFIPQYNTLSQNSNFQYHFSELVDIARIFSFRLDKLLSYSRIKDRIYARGNIVEGIYFLYLSNDTVVDGGYNKRLTEAVDVIKASDFLKHFSQQFPEMHIEKWQDFSMETVNKEVIGKLNLLVRTKAFSYCNQCEACKHIHTLE